jgi:hypothetical protein
MAWVTALELRNKIAIAVRRQPGDLPADVGEVIADALEKARGQIGGALAARGFTLAQVEAWPRLHEFSKDQALFNMEVYLRQSFKDQLGQLMALKDRMAELAVVVLTDAGGVPVEGGAARGGVLNVRSEFDARVARERSRRRGWYGGDGTGVRF